jgi:hypothetical protein
MQIELPDVREAIVAHDSLDQPALIVMDGNGIGRGPYQDLWARGFQHLLPGESMASSASDNLKIRRFSEGLFSLYDHLVCLPNAMPGRALETLLAEIAAFPDGKHDDQVDALSYVAAYYPRVIQEARRWGVKLGRLRLPSPKSRLSRPCRAIRNSWIGGDNELGADTQRRGPSRENHSGVGCIAAKGTPIHFIAMPLRRRRAGPLATRTPPGVKQPSLDRASSPDQTQSNRRCRDGANGRSDDATAFT